MLFVILAILDSTRFSLFNAELTPLGPSFWLTTGLKWQCKWMLNGLVCKDWSLEFLPINLRKAKTTSEVLHSPGVLLLLMPGHDSQQVTSQRFSPFQQVLSMRIFCWLDITNTHGKVRWDKIQHGRKWFRLLQYLQKLPQITFLFRPASGASPVC